jgi:hypothetical protein
MKLLSIAALVLNKGLLLFGLAILIAAAPMALPNNNTNCKKDGQINADGTLTCDNSLPCDVTGEACQITRWRKKVQHPYVKFCSCTIEGVVIGPDPTTGICMAISVELVDGGRVGKCTTSGCAAGITCSKNTSNKCGCG